MSEDMNEGMAIKWETQAKDAMSKKEYEKAISAYENALDIYQYLGWKGQVGILRKQIVKLESLKNIFNQRTRIDNDEAHNKAIKEKEADNLSKQARHLAFEKNFDEAINRYQQASKIYEEIGYSFQVRRFAWEIEKLKNMKTESQNSDEIRRESAANRIKSIAQEREERIRKEQEIKKQKERLKNVSAKEQAIQRAELADQSRAKITSKINREKSELKKWTSDLETKNQTKKNIELRQKSQKLQQLEEKKRQENIILVEAETLLDNAKSFLIKKDYEHAIQNYFEASKKFETIGWNDQAKTIKNEVDLVLKKKQEAEELERRKEEQRKLQQQEFDARIQKDKMEHMKLMKEEKKRLQQRTPEEQAKVELAGLNLKKGKIAEKKEKYKQAMQRYEYVLELYEELEFEQSDINEIKRAIQRVKVMI